MNTIRSVLVHVDATPANAAPLEFARRFALRHEADLSAMFVDWPARRPVLDKATADGGSPIRWLESSDADPVEAFCRQALYADLLVLGQHDPSAAVPGTAQSGFLESVLIATERPALILPYEGKFETAGHHVVIGWNATSDAARAITAALPWLRSAGQVHVLEAMDESEQRHVGDLDIAQYLLLHGVAATLHRHRASLTDAGGELLSLASEVGADLLVMACHRHSRLREFMLGGALRSVLQTMTLPVLIAH